MPTLAHSRVIGGRRTWRGRPRTTIPIAVFLSSVANAGVEIAKAVKNDRIDALVAQGAMIHGCWRPPCKSDLPGMVRAVTARKCLVVRMAGAFPHSRREPTGWEYKSGTRRGDACVRGVDRLLRSDGVLGSTRSNGTDDLGRAGKCRFVTIIILARFGSAIMLSIVGGFSQFLSGSAEQHNANGTTITTTDPVTGLVTTTQSGGNQNQANLQARQIAAQNVSQTLTNIAQEPFEELHQHPNDDLSRPGHANCRLRAPDLDFPRFTLTR